MNLFLNDRNKICVAKMSKIGPVWPKNRYGQESGQNGVPEGFFEKISRNMIVTEKMLMTNIIGNFVADNIVFEKEVLAHHPEELSLEIWNLQTFIRFLELSSEYNNIT